MKRTVARLLLLGSVWVGASLLPQSPALAGPQEAPFWLSTACEQDGIPSITSTACSPQRQPTLDPATAPAAHCTEAVICDASFADLRPLGIDTAPMESELDDLVSGFESAAQAGLQTVQGTSLPASFSGDFGWNDFFLAVAQNGNCQGNAVVDSQHCGWLYNHYTIFVGGDPRSTRTTVFEGRSGNNDPSDDWVPDRGPLPNQDWTSSTPSGLHHFHWGWRLGHFTGYIADSDEPFFPGKWHLDPWAVSKNGTDRGAFEIHGGSAGHAFTQSRTHGCIRIRAGAITSLKSLWVNHADNKHNRPGPDNFVHFSAP